MGNSREAWTVFIADEPGGHPRRVPHSHRLPRHLADGPFLTRDAVADGVGPGRLRGRDLDRRYWGVRSSTTADDLRHRCALLAARMPESAFFSHTTAAMLHGIPVPQWAERDPVLHVTVPAPARAPHAAGLHGHRLTVEPSDIVDLAGLRATTPTRTWCDLAQLLLLGDLVAAGDFVIHHRHPLASEQDLRRAIERRRSPRGRARAEAACPLLDDRSESAPESLLRVILVQAGLPPSRINHDVTDRFGEFVARTDLIFDDHRIVLEYQGDYHRTTKGQWRADMTRRSRLEADGWRVMELNADDLRDPIELVARIRRLIALAR